MIKLSRRGLFGALLGAASIPYDRLRAAPKTALRFFATRTTVYYTGYEIVGLTKEDVEAAAKYDWKSSAVKAVVNQS